MPRTVEIHNAKLWERLTSYAKEHNMTVENVTAKALSIYFNTNPVSHCATCDLIKKLLNSKGV